MAKFINFSPAQTVIVNKVYRTCRVGLEKAVQDIGSERYRRSFQAVMGGGVVGAVKQGEEILAETLKTMFMRVATLSFSVEYSAAMNGANADMLSFGGTAVKDVTSAVDSYRSDKNNAPRMPMRLGPPFFQNMQFISLSEQSQVETFLHELSHHAAGTIDDSNGGECYGWTGVTRLKGLGPARATRNAENVGFFCVRYCF